MKAIIAFRHGSPDVLQLRDVPKPEPLPNEVLIHNRFVGVNFVDTQHRSGSYYPVALPLIPGTEASGVVAAVGSDVTDFHVADRVAYAGYMGGNYAEYTRVPQDRLVPVPNTMPLELAAASLLQGLTAYMLAHQVYPLQSGDVALIHSAAGGVGGSMFEKNLSVPRTRGHLVSFGLANGRPVPLDISRLSGITGTKNRGSLSVTWASVNDYITTAEHLRAAADTVFGSILRGQLRIHITGVFPLEQAAQTHLLLESRATSGKLLLKVS
jgi:NADPH:quinone reductase-like Zn-dependent oxidoreductase